MGFIKRNRTEIKSGKMIFVTGGTGIPVKENIMAWVSSEILKMGRTVIWITPESLDKTEGHYVLDKDLNLNESQGTILRVMTEDFADRQYWINTISDLMFALEGGAGTWQEMIGRLLIEYCKLAKDPVAHDEFLQEQNNITPIGDHLTINPTSTIITTASGVNTEGLAPEVTKILEMLEKSFNISNDPEIEFNKAN